MSYLEFFIMAMLAPIAVWAALLAMMAREAGAARHRSPVTSVAMMSASRGDYVLDGIEAAHAETRRVNALYEEDFNYHRAA